MLKADGRARWIRAFELEPGLETDLGTIVLETSLHVRGRFVDSEGRAVSPRDARNASGEALVFPYMPEDRLGTHLGWTSLHVDGKDTGRFEAEGFGRAPYVFRSSGRPFPTRKGNLLVRSMIVDLRGGSIEDLEIALDRAFPVCVRAETEDAKDLAYSILGSDGSLCVRGDLAEPRTTWLASGDYRVLVGPDAAHVRETPFTLGNAPTTIPVEW